MVVKALVKAVGGPLDKFFVCPRKIIQNDNPINRVKKQAKVEIEMANTQANKL